jgi:hypothetical protein
LIVVADARPVIVWAAVRTCLRSNIAVVLAAIAVVVNSDTPFRPSVNVPADAAVLVTTMLLTTVVVAEGTVYKVVLDVAAAVRASALVTVAIVYSLS